METGGKLQGDRAASADGMLQFPRGRLPQLHGRINRDKAVSTGEALGGTALHG